MGREFDRLLDRLFERYSRHAIYLLSGFVCCLACMAFASARGAGWLVGVLLDCGTLALFSMLPLHCAPVAEWLMKDGEGSSSVDSVRSGWMGRILSGWRSGEIPMRVGLCVELPMGPDRKAAYQNELKARRWAADNTAASRMDADRAHTALDRQVFLDTHVIPFIEVRGGGDPDTIRVALTAVAPIRVSDITKALADYGVAVFGLPFEEPVVRDNTVSLVLHLNGRQSWAAGE
jgi:hypothetical protein